MEESNIGVIAIGIAIFWPIILIMIAAWQFSVNRIRRYNYAQMLLLIELCKKHGVTNEEINTIYEIMKRA